MRRVTILIGAVLSLALLALWFGGVFEGGDPAPNASTDHTGEPARRATQPDEPQGRTKPELHGTERPGEPPTVHSVPPHLTGPHLTGRVSDSAGAPIAGARVVSFPDTQEGTITTDVFEQPDFDGGSTTTDDQGRFAVGVSRKSAFHLLAVSAEGFSAQIVPQARVGDDVPVILERSLTLVGQVRDAEGNPVGGARIRAWILIDAFELDREVRADATGHYRIDGLPRALGADPLHWAGYMHKSWFELRAEGFAPLLVEDIKPKGSPPEPTQDFTLSRGAALSGRVTDADGGLPLSGVAVLLYSIEGMSGFRRAGGGGYSNPFAPRVVTQTTTDEQGGYRFEHVPSRGAHRSASHNGSADGGVALGGVIMSKPGYASQGLRLSLPAEGAQLEKSIALWPAGRVHGRVVDAEGKPVGGAYVNVAVEGRAFGASLPKGVEDLPLSGARTSPEDGTFLLTGVPVNRSASTAATLTVYPPNPPRSSARRYGRATQAKREITIEPGKPYDAGDIALEPREAYATTRVRVLTPAGQPYFGASVSRGQMMNAPRTDADGTLEWTWAKPTEKRPYTDVLVVVKAPGYAPTPAALHPPGSDQEEVSVTLRAAHTLAGRVLRADGQPGANLMVNVGDGTLPAPEVFPLTAFGSAIPGMQTRKDRALPLVYGGVRTDADGAFHFEDLPEGPYHLLAAAPRRVPQTGPGGGFLRVIQEHVQSDAEGVELRLPLDDSPQTGTVTGRIVDADTGKPVFELKVSLRRGARTLAFAFLGAGQMYTPGAAMGTIDASGAFTLPGVPVGSAELLVSAVGYAPTRVPNIEIRADTATPVPDVRLTHGVQVAGRVQAPEGISLKGRALSFTPTGAPEGRSWVQAKLAEDGRFEIGGFERGAYEVVAQPLRFGTNNAPPLLPEDGKPLVVKRTTGTLRYDVVLIAGGVLGLRPTDDRLPPAPWSSTAATAEQIQFGKASRIRVTGPGGSVLFEHTGLFQGASGGRSSLTVRPGRYTVRVAFPGGEVREESVEVGPGTRIDVRIEKH